MKDHFCPQHLHTSLIKAFMLQHAFQIGPILSINSNWILNPYSPPYLGIHTLESLAGVHQSSSVCHVNIRLTGLQTSGQKEKAMLDEIDSGRNIYSIFDYAQQFTCLEIKITTCNDCIFNCKIYPIHLNNADYKKAKILLVAPEWMIDVSASPDLYHWTFGIIFQLLWLDQIVAKVNDMAAAHFWYIYILCVSRYRSFLYILYFNINRWSNKFLAWSHTIHFTLRVNPNLWPVFNSQFHRPIALGKILQWVNPISSHSLPEVEHQQLSCCCIVCVIWYVAWITSTKGMTTWNHVPTRQRYVWNSALVLN